MGRNNPEKMREASLELSRRAGGSVVRRKRDERDFYPAVGKEREDEPSTIWRPQIANQFFIQEPQQKHRTGRVNP